MGATVPIVLAANIALDLYDEWSRRRGHAGMTAFERETAAREFAQRSQAAAIAAGQRFDEADKAHPANPEDQGDGA